MMTGNFLRHSKRLILSLLILFVSNAAVFSQKKLSGNLNQPKAHVVTITGSDRIIVDDVTGFSAPDTILLIQMQGVGILTGAADYGNIQNFLGQPGMHEFLIIQSVNTLTHEIIFRNDLLKTYDTRGNIQIVRVPYYNSAIVTGKLFCDAWSNVTHKGGVLALIVGRSLKLNADIDVSNSGFTGGKDTIGIGRCALLAPVTTGKSYPQNFYNAGYKGEGIAIHNDAGVLLAPLNVKGSGPDFTGGGGGDGRFSGGGGGSNSGAGGVGGYEDNSCSGPQEGGLGGIKAESAIEFPSLIDRIYLGGGGGASTSLSGLSQPGGNGGGIIIIVTDSIIGNTGRIISNGGTAGTAVVNGGSGGGGAGGSIAISLNSYGSAPLTLSVNGGNGGDNPGFFGEGGGGGGGLVFVKISPSGNVQISKDGGLQGNFLNPPTNPGLPGDPGVIKTGFKSILNGFLFNSIRSSVTGNQVDSICSNVIPPKITGTIPVGGTGPYTYLWEKSYNQVTWVPLTNDPDPTNYTPTLDETATVWYRRTITDNSPTPLVDISKPVKMIVQPAITANNIGKDTTICHGQNPLPIGSVPINSTPSNGNGIYRYKWLQNLTNSSWDTLQVAVGSIINGKGYDPPSLIQTTYYKRFVQSGRCIDYSSTVTITVLPGITGNSTIRSDSVICEGIVFPILSATAPGGGNLSYTYQWQDSVSTWSPASGINTNTNSTYSVDTSKFPIVNNEKRYFRRVVFSGPFNTCQSKSVPILLTRFHKIKNNSVQSDQIICSGDVPLALSGVTASPTGGTGAYSFLWEQSPNGTALWTNAIGTSTNNNYGPPELLDSTWYRRTVYSGVYKSLPVCTNTSPTVAINVQPSIINNSISILGSGPDTIICSGQKPNQIRKIGLPLGGGNSTYATQWTVSSSSIGSYTDISGATGLTFSEAALSSSEYYKLKVVSGKCISLSNIVTVNVLPGISGFNIEPDQSICKNLPLSPVGSVTPGPSGGDGTYRYKWQQNVTNGGWADISTNGTSSSYSKSSISDPTQYRRYIYSGLRDCCHDTSNIVSISILPLPATPYPGPDTIIYSINKIYHMKAHSPPSGETGRWKILDNGTGSIDDTTGYNTTVRNLSVGNNSFLWTVNKGPCKLKDSVIIELLKNFVPQGFSPNGDAYNNTFVVEGLYLDDNYVDLSIVNGAGTEVFNTSNRDNKTWTEWDGKNSNGIDLPQGTYYYMLKIASKKSNGPVSRLSGFIVLKRY
jgi:gliding motility-associated-like protein